MKAPPRRQLAKKLQPSAAASTPGSRGKLSGSFAAPLAAQREVALSKAAEKLATRPRDRSSGTAIPRRAPGNKEARMEDRTKAQKGAKRNAGGAHGSSRERGHGVVVAHRVYPRQFTEGELAALRNYRPMASGQSADASSFVLPVGANAPNTFAWDKQEEAPSWDIGPTLVAIAGEPIIGVLPRLSSRNCGAWLLPPESLLSVRHHYALSSDAAVVGVPSSDSLGACSLGRPQRIRLTVVASLVDTAHQTGMKEAVALLLENAQSSLIPVL